MGYPDFIGFSLGYLKELASRVNGCRGVEKFLGVAVIGKVKPIGWVVLMDMEVTRDHDGNGVKRGAQDLRERGRRTRR